MDCVSQQTVALSGLWHSADCGTQWTAAVSRLCLKSVDSVSEQCHSVDGVTQWAESFSGLSLSGLYHCGLCHSVGCIIVDRH